MQTEENKQKTDLFLELDEELIKKEETSLDHIAGYFSYDSTFCKKYLALKHYFPPTIQHFQGEENDFVVLNELRSNSLSDSLSIYIEALICKCKAHFRDSCFSAKFSQYAKKCFIDIKNNNDFKWNDLRLFLGFDSACFIDDFNEIFREFLYSFSDHITISQLSLSGYFLELYGALSEENRSAFSTLILQKIDDPRDDLNFVISAIQLIKRFIFIAKDKDKDTFKYLYAKIVDGLSTNNPRYEAFLMQEPYQTALTYLFEIKSSDYRLIDSITNKKAFANKKALENIKSHAIPLDPVSAKSLKDQFENMETEFKRRSFSDSVYYFLNLLEPFSVKTIQKTIDDKKRDSVFGDLFNETYLSEDGELLNGRKLKKYEQFSLDAREPISILIDISYINIINCFFRANKDRLNTQAVHGFVKKIVSSNILISESDKKEMIVIFGNLFLSKFGDKFNDFCSQLEKSLRFWLSAKGVSTKKMKPESNDDIGLTDIFNFATNNRYRDAVEEIIDEDYYFTLTWMLNDDFGWNLRNNATHGKLTGEKKRSYSVLLASFQMFKLYLANWFR